MSNPDCLAGLARRISENFVGMGNMRFIIYMENLPEDITQGLEINILGEAVSPENADSEEFRQIIKRYRNLLAAEAEKSGIGMDEIRKAVLKINHTPGKTFAKTFICNAIIASDGNEYTHEAKTFYSS